MQPEPLTPEEQEWLDSLPEDKRAIIERYAALVMQEAMLNTIASYAINQGFRKDKAVLNRFAHKPVVYLLLNEMDGLYKIGMTRNLEQRARASFGMRSDQRSIIAIDAIIYPSNELAQWEKYWHAMLEDRRIGVTEWFELNDHDVEMFRETARLRNDKQYTAPSISEGGE